MLDFGSPNNLASYPPGPFAIRRFINNNAAKSCSFDSSPDLHLGQSFGEWQDPLYELVQVFLALLVEWEVARIIEPDNLL